MARRGAAEIALEMRQAIEDGVYKRFERLPASRELAGQFGVARNTLRDALYQLEKDGLLETRPGSGTYVTASAETPIPAAVAEASPLELIDARFALEPHICRLAVLHGRREDFDTLSRLCDTMDAAVEDRAAFAVADAAFHRALAAATRNNLLIWLIKQISENQALEQWGRMRNLTLDPEMIREYNRLHRQILDAIIAHQPEQAAEAMKEHLQAARSSLTRAYET